MNSMVRIVAGIVLGGLALCGSRAARSQEKPKSAPLPEAVTWKLQDLDQPPFKVVSTRFDPKEQKVTWIMELVRDLDVYEDLAYWAPGYKDGKRTRFKFEFHNADGIVMKTVDGRYLGDYVNKAGKRFGVALELLELPQDVYSFTRTVVALAK